MFDRGPEEPGPSGHCILALMFVVVVLLSMWGYA